MSIFDKKEEKKSLSYETHWLDVKKNLKELFGDSSLHPSLEWILELNTKIGKKGLEVQMTQTFKPPFGKTGYDWFPYYQINAWTYVEQEKILLMEKAVIDRKIAILQRYITRSEKVKSKHERKQIRGKVDKRAAHEVLVKMLKDKKRLSRSRDAFDQIELEELDVLIKAQRSKIAGIDTSGATVIKWHKHDTPHVTELVSMDEVINAAILERNELQVGEMSVLSDKISATVAAKEYWLSFSHDMDK